MRNLNLAILLCLLLSGSWLVADLSRPSGPLAGETHIGTNHYGFGISRAVTANDTVLAKDTKDWTDALANFHLLDTKYSNVEVLFYAYGDGDSVGDPDGGTCDFQIYTVSEYGGMVAVCTANDAVFGKQQLSHNPSTGTAFWSGVADPNYTWMDTCTTTTILTDLWSTGVQQGNEDGADGVTTLQFDTLGSKGIYVLVNDMTNVTSVTYVIRGIGG
jgi:hypothetical protein